MHPDVLSAEVTLDPQQAVIEMSRHVSTDELQKTIGNPKYTISDSPASHDTHMGSESTNWFATYRPILLIFGRCINRPKRV